MNIEVRNAEEGDAEYLFKLANDRLARQNSFTSNQIKWPDHKKWFQKKLVDPNSYIYVFLSGNRPIGTLRIDVQENETIIGVTIDPDFRGQGLGPVIIKKGCNEFWQDNENEIVAYIKKENVGSIKSFEKAGFKQKNTGMIEGVESSILIAKKHEFRSS